jgi:hypothetical protein
MRPLAGLTPHWAGAARGEENPGLRARGALHPGYAEISHTTQQMCQWPSRHYAYTDSNFKLCFQSMIELR